MTSTDTNIHPFGPGAAHSLELRLWLELAAAGLSGIAALSPGAREAIDLCLEEAIRSRSTQDPLVGLLNWVRFEVASDPAELKLARRLEEAILAKASAMPESDEDQPLFRRAAR